MKQETLTFTVGRVAPTLNRWERLHWTARKRIKDQWVAEILAQRPAVWSVVKQCKIHVQRGYVRQPADPDNLVASCKPILDSLVRANIILDDSPTVIQNLDVSQIKQKQADLSTKIRLHWIDHEAIPEWV